MAILGRDAARHVATKTVGSAIDRCDAGLAWYAQGEVVGGGIFALRRPRPYSRHLRGFRCDTSPPTTICDHMGINGNGEWEGNDAARRVATSSEKRENRFETAVFKGPRRKAQRGAIVYRRHFLRVKRFQSRNSNFSKTVATRRAASL